MATILITSATGKVAGATLAALRGSGHQTIGLVRNLAKARPLESLGAILREGDLERPSTLSGAFDGVDTVMLIAPPGYLAPALTSNAIWQAKRAGVKHIVRLSAVGAAHDAPTVNSRLHALSDEELRASQIDFTLLKPHFFFQNLLGMAPTIKQQGCIYFALGDAKLPMIDVRDIGAVAAKVLVAPKAHAKQVYTLTSGQAVSMQDVAAELSSALEKPVKYIPISVAQAVEGMQKMGADNYTQAAMGDYLAAYSQGWQSTPTPDAERILGRKPFGLKEFVHEFAAAFR